MGRLIRRLVAMAVLALLILAVAYHLTVAGTLTLEGLYGPLDARLMIAGAYAVLTLAVLDYLLAIRATAAKDTEATDKRRTSAARAPQDVRMAMLLESILLGCTAGRKKSRHS